MHIRSIPRETVIRPSALPQWLPGSGGSAVLLIHGFTGYPGDMLYLGRRLQAAGFAVSIPRLPGHGTNGRDFLQVGWSDWLRAAVDAYLALSSTHEKVHVAGLSMGGLLTILLAAQFEPERIALAAPALAIANRTAGLTRWLAPFLARMPSRVGGEEPSEDPDHKALFEEYWSWNWVRPTANLLTLKRMALRALPRVRSKTLTIVSKADTTVPADVAELVDRSIPARQRRTLVLERSSHVVVNDVEKERVADEIAGWFTE